MIGIQFRKSIPRYFALRIIGPRWPGIYSGFASSIALRRLPEPPLPTPQWVRVRPLLSGICGSDLATICAKGSPYFSPLTSTPFVVGHEVVGTIAEVGAEVEGLQTGDRVVIQPALGCRVRNIEPPCGACASGQLALCRNVTRGTISAGIQTGFCRDTGGSWSESFVAHTSQVYAVPSQLENEEAVLTEPFACALHAVLRAQPHDRETVLVVGCGAVGLLVIAAIRALGSAARIVAVAKYQHQAEHARRLGANQVLMHQRDVVTRYAMIAEALGAELHPPEIGKPTVLGGADVTFDCVASSASIDDSVRCTTGGGKMVLVGMPAMPSGIDWTSIWYKELSVHAAYAYGQEEYGGQTRMTFDLALEMLTQNGAAVRRLVGEPFALHDYREAVHTALSTGRTESVKTVFRIQSD